MNPNSPDYLPMRGAPSVSSVESVVNSDCLAPVSSTVPQTINHLLVSSTLEEADDEIATLVAIRCGVSAADAGNVKAHDEVKHLLADWTAR